MRCALGLPAESAVWISRQLLGSKKGDLFPFLIRTATFPSSLLSLFIRTQRQDSNSALGPFYWVVHSAFLESKVNSIYIADCFFSQCTELFPHEFNKHKILWHTLPSESPVIYPCLSMGLKGWLGVQKGRICQNHPWDFSWLIPPPITSLTLLEFGKD